uniref:Transthyretin-like family protein n=1 Tax=Panagrellus redivivus TaxID=6233 RepID=A0A7E4VZV4_PANRE
MGLLRVFSILSIVICAVFAFNQQSVGVRGRLMCGSTALNNTQVKLWNKVNLGRDDQLAASKTDDQGNFQISGGTGALLPLNVHLKVYHNCDRSLPCQRKVDFTIPPQYVTRTSQVTNWYDMGMLNMQTMYKGEGVSCIN